MCLGDRMKQGESRVTNMILKMLGDDIRNQIDSYVDDICSRYFTVLESSEQVREVFNESLDDFLSNLSEEELFNLRSYTGYDFWNINAVLRNNWRYETNGVLTADKTVKYREISKAVSSVLDKFKCPSIDFVTFRGTTIDAFSSYGINDLSDLETLKGNFLYEQGFTSTSILENTSYFKKTLDDGRFCNVGIRYLIPSGNNDGALLLDSNLSYSVGQNEFLLNTGALSKVVDVKIDDNTAVLTVVLIPKKVYDINYSMNMSGSRKI